MFDSKLLVAATLAVAAIGAHAQAGAPATPRVDQREARQHQRIDPGVASGRLTPRETRRLEQQQTRIARAEAHAKADGVVTVAERRQLRRMQDRASRDIRRQKHDVQDTSRS